jgi:acyl carrier protein
VRALFAKILLFPDPGEVLLPSDPEIIRTLTDFVTAEFAAPRQAPAPAPDFPIVDAGLVDSLGLFKLISFIEEKFSVTIAPEDILIENFATINAAAALVSAIRSAGESRSG